MFFSGDMQYRILHFPIEFCTVFFRFSIEFCYQRTKKRKTVTVPNRFNARDEADEEMEVDSNDEE